MSRIVQVANFVTPVSGGLRTALRHLAEGYAAAGHDVVQIVPGSREAVEWHSWGQRILIGSPRIPGMGGYRLLVRPGSLATLLDGLAPDRLEVHDRTTLRCLGRWGSRRGVRSLVVSHERLDRLLAQWAPQRVTASPAGARTLASVAVRMNTALASGFDGVVCTTAWAGEEYAGLPGLPGLPGLHYVPLGVDLDRFHPQAASTALRAELAPPGERLLACASRLSIEKRPSLAIETAGELRRRGYRVRLALAGQGPLRARLERQASGLPVRLLGHLDGPGPVAALLATADVVLAPGPVETFGLAALESLACGTPVVVNSASALPEVVAEGGRQAAGTATCLADAAASLLDADPTALRLTARSRAEQFPWSRTIAGFLVAHRLAADGSASIRPPAVPLPDAVPAA